MTPVAYLADRNRSVGLPFCAIERVKLYAPLYLCAQQPGGSTSTGTYFNSSYRHVRGQVQIVALNL
jgi:hypothetical protein